MKKTIFILTLFVFFSPSSFGKEVFLKCDKWFNAEGKLDLQVDLENRIVYETNINGIYESEILSIDKNSILAHGCDTVEYDDGSIYEYCIDYEISTNSNYVDFIIYLEKHINDKNNNILVEDKMNCNFNKNDLLVEIQDFMQQEKENEEALLVEAQKKKIETCEAYGFEIGSEPFGQCIFKLMELELEYAKLENEQLRLQAQAQQAELNNQTALAQSLAAQAQAANRDKGLRLQQFGLAMQGFANALQQPSSLTNPKVTCQNLGSQLRCW